MCDKENFIIHGDYPNHFYIQNILLMIFFFSFYRCGWLIWWGNYWTVTREVPVCLRRVLSLPLSQSTNPFWQALTQTPVSEDSFIASDWATVFCPSSGQDPYWDPNQRYAVVWKFISMAFSFTTDVWTGFESRWICHFATAAATSLLNVTCS